MKKTSVDLFNLEEVLENLRHYLPTQAPLKDFIHHNTLHAFQDRDFHQALYDASNRFGYKTYLSLSEFRNKHKQGLISDYQLNHAILRMHPSDDLQVWKDLALKAVFNENVSFKSGLLRHFWKEKYHINLGKAVHPKLFRILSNFLDQGIAIRKFPFAYKGLISSLREMEGAAAVSLFSNSRARQLLLHTHCNPEHLLELLVGDPLLYEQYLFDQQFEHPGWSGMFATLETSPELLLERRMVHLKDLIALELLLEIDALDARFGENNWKPLAHSLTDGSFNTEPGSQYKTYFDVLAIWQEASEWQYYDEVLSGISLARPKPYEKIGTPSFDAFLCIDDRECSFRRHLEMQDPGCRTFGTPGFFNVEFYYQPEHGKYYTKSCPAPVTPAYLIREHHKNGTRKTDVHFTNHTHSLVFGWLISQTLGFFSAFRLMLNIFKPSVSPATSFSFRHMHKKSSLIIEHQSDMKKVNGLQIGFTTNEMADRMEGLLKSTGLTSGFADIVYIIGHGASSVNNTHYAGYDCGACSGRPGSVNARVAAFMLNHPVVRDILMQRGITISSNTVFLGALHDTTRDEIEFYDDEMLSDGHKIQHHAHAAAIRKALTENAYERSRRFELLNSDSTVEKVHEQVKQRSVSLFEPRPELNHATNALCIVGRRSLTEHLFLDRRAFMNSYDPEGDKDGKYLMQILKAAAPVCGGINLEYYFSRTDNYRLGAGTKLPHNVMGLIGVSNGIDGDLLPGLPLQMIEVHDPLRLMIIVEQKYTLVSKVLDSHLPTKEWFDKNWINLICVDPVTRQFFRYEKGHFVDYVPQNMQIKKMEDSHKLFNSVIDNLPVMLTREVTL